MDFGANLLEDMKLFINNQYMNLLIGWVFENKKKTYALQLCGLKGRGQFDYCSSMLEKYNHYKLRNFKTGFSAILEHPKIDTDKIFPCPQMAQLHFAPLPCVDVVVR